MTARIILGVILGCGAAVSAFAQESVPGKVYVAEISGGVSFTLGGKVLDLKKGDSQPAQGARIETAAGASVILVYSNGTSIFVDEKTVVEINRFVQVPFPSGVDTAVIEPSVSNTLAKVTQGRVIITTNELATGTSMVYLTPQARTKIRGKEVVIEVNMQETRITVLTGDATVTPENAAAGSVGRILHDGQMAVVRSASASTAAGTVEVTEMDQQFLNSISTKVAATERAQKVVVFESVNPPGGGTPDIQAKSVVPTDLPVPLTVSPSTLRTGG